MSRIATSPLARHSGYGRPRTGMITLGMGPDAQGSQTVKPIKTTAFWDPPMKKKSDLGRYPSSRPLLDSRATIRRQLNCDAEGSVVCTTYLGLRLAFRFRPPSQCRTTPRHRRACNANERPVSLVGDRSSCLRASAREEDGSLPQKTRPRFPAKWSERGSVTREGEKGERQDY